ncbi:hypothetical protein [Maribacter sp. IgM3_T14_3]|uniref:hypothetical protein n=1 Tax=Maribacter sp. IgM3_T14_3 TaxID=3415140 RepID=UPI003C6FD774
MKKSTVFLVFFFFLSTITFSQEFQTALVNTELKLDSGEIPDNLIMKASQDENGFTKIIVTENEEEKAKILLKPFGYQLFKTKLVHNLFPTLGLNLSAQNDEYLTKLYADISSYFFTVNERPQAATISLLDKVPVYIYGKYISDSNENEKPKFLRTKIGDLKNPKINISFYSGFVEKIEVTGKINNVDITLANEYSIGVSSKKNIEDFSTVRLFSYYSYEIGTKKNGPKTPSNLTDYQSDEIIDGQEYTVTVQKQNKSEEIKNNFKLDENIKSKFFVYLDDLIKYERIIDVNANDISPDKQKITLDKQQRSSKLYREESTKIIEAVIYSDLMGALDDDNPNGTIQTEVNKKFNIKTKRRDLFGGGGGMLEYLDASVLLSKIEEDDKYLLPTDNQFGLLDLFRQRNFSAGGLLNVGTHENQNLKLNIFYESGVKFSRSGYKLTEEGEEKNANSIEWVHQLKIHLFPEKRYGLIFRNKLFYYEILDNNSDFISLLDKKKDWLNIMELSAYLDIGTSAKVFVRYALVHELSDFNNNFSRFQIGTSFFFLQKNRKDK